VKRNAFGGQATINKTANKTTNKTTNEDRDMKKIVKFKLKRMDKQTIDMPEFRDWDKIIVDYLPDGEINVFLVTEIDTASPMVPHDILVKGEGDELDDYLWGSAGCLGCEMIGSTIVAFYAVGPQ